MDNVLTPDFSDPFAMFICLYMDGSCISSIELKPLSTTDVLLSWSSTYIEYANHKYNKFMRCVAIIICGRLGYTTLKSLSINPTTTYLSMKYFEATATINKQPLSLLSYEDLVQLHSKHNNNIDLSISISSLMRLEDSIPVIYKMFHTFCSEITCYDSPSVDGGTRQKTKKTKKQKKQRKSKKVH